MNLAKPYNDAYLGYLSCGGLLQVSRCWLGGGGAAGLQLSYLTIVYLGFAQG